MILTFQFRIGKWPKVGSCYVWDKLKVIWIWSFILTSYSLQVVSPSQSILESCMESNELPERRWTIPWITLATHKGLKVSFLDTSQLDMIGNHPESSLSIHWTFCPKNMQKWNFLGRFALTCCLFFWFFPKYASHSIPPPPWAFRSIFTHNAHNGDRSHSQFEFADSIQFCVTMLGLDNDFSWSVSV